MKKQFLFVVYASILLVFTACNPDETGEEVKTDTVSSIFVVNEGAFNNNNGSISLINSKTGQLTNNYFSTQNNGASLGDIVQSMTVADDKGIIVVNNSQKVVIVDMKDFRETGEIGNLSYPRYACYVGDNKAYVSNGSMAGKLYLIDLQSAKVIDSVVVGNGPEKMLKVGDYLYVVNSGGWVVDSTVSVVDIKTNKVVDKIYVGYNPADIAIDKNNNIWVICKGKVVYDPNTWAIVEETSSEIYKINGATNKVELSFEVGQTGDYFNPKDIEAFDNGQKMLFVEKQGLYMFDIDNPSNPASPVVQGSFYGLSVLNNERIFVFDAGTFQAAGTAYDVTDFNTDTKFQVGIGPNSAVYYSRIDTVQ